MEIVFLTANVIFFLISFSFAIIDFLHYFQLNSYHYGMQIKWMFMNYSKLVIHIIIFLFGLLLLRFDSNFALIVLPVIFLISILINKPKKAKKPLVYTNRIKRIIISISILVLIVVLAAICLKINSLEYVILGMLILYLLAPVLVLLGNFINTPIESVIKRYYINDAKKILRFSNELIIIGVTGSYGKTSLKYYLNTILKAKYNVLMTPESYNTPMGVVKTIRNSLNATHQIFICEMGAKKVGEIKEICDIVHPKHGIITAIGPQHLETFKSLENIQKTKFELADALPSDGLLFLNIDDKNITSHKSERPFVSYGVQGHGEYAVSNLKLSNIGTTFTVKKLNGEVCDFSTKLIGSHNVLNIVGAIAIANQLGIELSQIRTQVKKIEGVPHRLQLINKGKDLIIDDAFNSNPNGAAAALETLNLFDGFKILITPGMVELGSKQAEYNYSFGKNAATVCDYVVIVGTTNKDSILNGLEDSGFLQQKIYLAKTIQNALNQINLVQSNGQNKIILLENDLPDNF